MQPSNVLITGGAGFVGSSLALRLRQEFPSVQVIAFDNLRRRGSELAVGRLSAAGVKFVHGDVRCPSDLRALDAFDVVIDCAAEPSVQAGLTGSPAQVFDNNLTGTLLLAEEAHRRGAAFLFLSTSRVYPIEPLNQVPFEETETRFSWAQMNGILGCSPKGVNEAFPLVGVRSPYGASKLAAELVLQEYATFCGLRVLINRCGLLAGPWQMGKVDQGVIALWVARHVFGRPLRYIGFGGTGKQVRDVLHIDDLFDLVATQLRRVSSWRGQVYNVGGGVRCSTSLGELTRLCQTVTGNTVPIENVQQTSPVDVRVFITDSTRAEQDFSWCPRRNIEDVVVDVHGWIRENSGVLTKVLDLAG